MFHNTFVQEKTKQKTHKLNLTEFTSLKKFIKERLLTLHIPRDSGLFINYFGNFHWYKYLFWLLSFFIEDTKQQLDVIQ